MPTLKQISCSIELGRGRTRLKEYGARYSDGHVESFIAVPDLPLPFCVHVQSEGYIAPGLAAFVFMDGEYQCNRNRQELKLPGKGVSPRQYEVDFTLRQKEEKKAHGGFVGREWTFAQLDTSSADTAAPQNPNFLHNVGTIEVVVLRCKTLLDLNVPRFRDVAKLKTITQVTHRKAKSTSAASDVGMCLAGLYDGAGDEPDSQVSLTTTSCASRSSHKERESQTISSALMSPRVCTVSTTPSGLVFDRHLGRYVPIKDVGQSCPIGGSDLLSSSVKKGEYQVSGTGSPTVHRLPDDLHQGLDDRSDLWRAGDKGHGYDGFGENFYDGNKWGNRGQNDMRGDKYFGLQGTPRREIRHKFREQGYAVSNSSGSMRQDSVRQQMRRVPDAGTPAMNEYLNQPVHPLLCLPLPTNKYVGKDGNCYIPLTEYSAIAVKFEQHIEALQVEQSHLMQLMQSPELASCGAELLARHYQNLKLRERELIEQAVPFHRATGRGSSPFATKIPSPGGDAEINDVANWKQNAQVQHGQGKNARPAQNGIPNGGWNQSGGGVVGGGSPLNKGWNVSDGDRNHDREGMANSVRTIDHFAEEKNNRSRSHIHTPCRGGWGDQQNGGGGGGWNAENNHGWGDTGDQNNKDNDHFGDNGSRRSQRSSQRDGNGGRGHQSQNNNAGGWGDQTQKNDRSNKGTTESHPRSTEDDNSKAPAKEYWENWRRGSMMPHESFDPNTKKKRETPRQVYTYAATPLPKVSNDKIGSASHGVQAGKGADYIHRTIRPEYIDDMKKPYAVFSFKYRSKDVLQKILKRRISGDVEAVVQQVHKDELMTLPKHKLIEELMQVRGQVGPSKAPKAGADKQASFEDNGASENSPAAANGWDNQQAVNTAPSADGWAQAGDAGNSKGGRNQHGWNDANKGKAGDANDWAADNNANGDAGAWINAGANNEWGAAAAGGGWDGGNDPQAPKSTYAKDPFDVSGSQIGKERWGNPVYNQEANRDFSDSIPRVIVPTGPWSSRGLTVTATDLGNKAEATAPPSNHARQQTAACKSFPTDAKRAAAGARADTLATQPTNQPVVHPHTQPTAPALPDYLPVPHISELRDPNKDAEMIEEFTEAFLEAMNLVSRPGEYDYHLAFEIAQRYEEARLKKSHAIIIYLAALTKEAPKNPALANELLARYAKDTQEMKELAEMAKMAYDTARTMKAEHPDAPNDPYEVAHPYIPRNPLSVFGWNSSGDGLVPFGQGVVVGGGDLRGAQA